MGGEHISGRFTRYGDPLFGHAFAWLQYSGGCASSGFLVPSSPSRRKATASTQSSGGGRASFWSVLESRICLPSFAAKGDGNQELSESCRP